MEANGNTSDRMAQARDIGNEKKLHDTMSTGIVSAEHGDASDKCRSEGKVFVRETSNDRISFSSRSRNGGRNEDTHDDRWGDKGEYSGP